MLNGSSATLKCVRDRVEIWLHLLGPVESRIDTEQHTGFSAHGSSRAGYSYRLDAIRSHNALTMRPRN